jgi:hypothetical protein
MLVARHPKLGRSRLSPTRVTDGGTTPHPSECRVYRVPFLPETNRQVVAVPESTTDPAPVRVEPKDRAGCRQMRGRSGCEGGAMTDRRRDAWTDSKCLPLTGTYPTGAK